MEDLFILLISPAMSCQIQCLRDVFYFYKICKQASTKASMTAHNLFQHKWLKLKLTAALNAG